MTCEVDGTPGKSGTPTFTLDIETEVMNFRAPCLLLNL